MKHFTAILLLLLAGCAAPHPAQPDQRAHLRGSVEWDSPRKLYKNLRPFIYIFDQWTDSRVYLSDPRDLLTGDLTSVVVYGKRCYETRGRFEILEVEAIESY